MQENIETSVSEKEALKQLIKNKVKHLLIASVGNRLTALGYANIATAQLCASINQKILMVLSSHNILPNVVLEPIAIAFILFYLFQILSAPSLLLGTFMGTTTLRAYKRTKKFIERTGGVNGYFFQQNLDKDDGGLGKTFGYCSLQGMYLAMKEEGLTKEFKTLKVKHSKVKLPNF